MDNHGIYGLIWNVDSDTATVRGQGKVTPDGTFERVS
jgi:hypothetical protein